MAKYAGQDEDEVCGSCRFLPTKPEAVPSELIEFVGAALDFAEMQRGGSTFAYPDALTLSDWAAIRGLQRGRDQAEMMRSDRERKKGGKR